MPAKLNLPPFFPMNTEQQQHQQFFIGIDVSKLWSDASLLVVTNHKRGPMHSLKAAPALNPVLLKLKDLWTSRSRLLTQLNDNRTYLRELKNISDSSTQKTLEGAYQAAVEGLAKSLAAIGTEIKRVVAQNEDLETNYELLLSVPGIGHLTAVYLLCCTANFCSAPSGKQLACYAALAPFGHNSGTSVKGRPRVHKMANKELKRLLYMGARTAIRHDAEMKAYYERKKRCCAWPQLCETSSPIQPKP
jgi:transposase